MESKVAVLYLLRNGNPPAHFVRFLKSLERNPAGRPFTLYLIQKGFPPNFVHPRIIAWNREKTPIARIISVPDEIGMDIHAYHASASQISEHLCLFFNSYSQILHPNWLLYYLSAFEQLGPGSLVGATGNWAATKNHRAFPNPHVRSNAFLIERELFLEFELPEREKQACIEFEAGRHGMTRKVLARGGKAGVVDRFGKVYPPEEFPISRTLRSHSQENLLVSDNVTTAYQIAGIRLRKRQSRGFWRDHAVIAPQPLSERYQVACEWESAGESIFPWQFLKSLVQHPRRYLF